MVNIFVFGVFQSENACSRLRRNVSLYLRIHISCIFNCQDMGTCKIYQSARCTNILHKLLLRQRNVNLVWALLEVQKNQRCKYNFTSLFTPWSRVVLEKLTGSQLVKKFPAVYGNRRFITAFTRARHLSLICASSIQSMFHILLLEDPS
jgi:hypothetical protein